MFCIKGCKKWDFLNGAYTVASFPTTSSSQFSSSLPILNLSSSSLSTVFNLSQSNYLSLTMGSCCSKGSGGGFSVGGAPSTSGCCSKYN